jgi:hypothetical protein
MRAHTEESHLGLGGNRRKLNVNIQTSSVVWEDGTVRKLSKKDWKSDIRVITECLYVQYH